MINDPSLVITFLVSESIAVSEFVPKFISMILLDAPPSIIVAHAGVAPPFKLFVGSRH